MPSINKCIEEWKHWRFISGASENSIYSQGRYLKKFSEHCHNLDAGSITPELCHSFVNSDDGRSANTKAFMLVAVKSLMEFCLAKGHCLINPSKIVKVNKRRLSHNQKEKKERKPVTEVEFETLLAQAPYFYRQAIAIGWFTGLRLGDICGLEWAELQPPWVADEVKCYTHLICWTQKRDKRVSLDLSLPILGDGMLTTILGEIKSVDEELCFPTEHATNTYPKHRALIPTKMRRIFDRAGVTDKSFHCLRHSFVSRLAKAGVSLEDIGTYVGHSNTQTTEGYSHGI
jgi:integrase